MRRQVERAQQIQRERFAGSGICYNSQIPPGEIAVYCKTSEGAEKMLQGIVTSERKGMQPDPPCGKDGGGSRRKRKNRRRGDRGSDRLSEF